MPRHLYGFNSLKLQTEKEANFHSGGMCNHRGEMVYRIFRFMAYI